MIIKNRSSSLDWLVGHVGIGLGSGRLLLNSNDPNSNAGASSYWNNTAGTSSVFSIGSHPVPNKSGDNIIAYCFAPVEGYSSMGIATGSGTTDGPYIHTGFKPRFLIYKRSDGVSNWLIYDTARNPTNVGLYVLSADNSGGGNNYDAHNASLGVDFLSNGFKIRSSHTEINTSGASYIYYAVGDPFKTARAR